MASRLDRRAWIEQMPAPVLRPGDAVVADDLGSHKVAGVPVAVEAGVAALRCLPPYSPDSDPAGQSFAKFNVLLRSGAARTGDALRAAVRHLLARLPPAERGRHLVQCGYGRSG